MKLFVAFHYHEEEKWIRELVLPLIEALDITVVTGENIHGNIIVTEIPAMIKKCDGVLAFITKKWTDHPWVRDEAVAAGTLGMQVLEVRDNTLQFAEGMMGGRQVLNFDINKKEVLLVELAKTLSRWRRKNSVKNLLILPAEIMQQAGLYMKNKTLVCKYNFRDGNEESEIYETRPYKLPAGLGVDVKNIPSQNALIQLTLEGPDGFSWECAYESINFISIKLEKI